MTFTQKLKESLSHPTISHHQQRITTRYLRIFKSYHLLRLFNTQSIHEIRGHKRFLAEFVTFRRFNFKSICKMFNFTSAVYHWPVFRVSSSRVFVHPFISLLQWKIVAALEHRNISLTRNAYCIPSSIYIQSLRLIDKYFCLGFTDNCTASLKKKKVLCKSTHNLSSVE